jgi:hypothetical protein
MFGFKKKKDINTVTIMHYEGLKGFTQDFPCVVTLEDEFLVFKNNDGNVTKLPCDRILTIDSMTEQNFRAKYHNDKAKTKHGTVWFKVITYTASTGEENYIALWDVGSKADKFFEQVKPQPTEVIL